MGTWNPDYPVRELPKKIAGYYREEARRLYEDLRARKLQIGTAQVNQKRYGRWQKIRVVLESNPRWYSEFYRQFKRRKRKRGSHKKSGNGLHTFCERKRVENALMRIMTGRDFKLGAPRKKSGPSNLYQTLLREIIHQNLIAGFVDREYQSGVEPNNKVREFFGLESLDSEEFWADQSFPISSTVDDEVPF